MAGTGNLSVKFNLTPGLDVNAFNVLLREIKKALGVLGKGIKLLDPEVIKKEMDEIESEVISGSKDIDKEVDKVVGKAAGKATSPLTKAGGGLFSNLKTNITPGLDVNAFNVLLREIKKALGVLGKGIKLLDPEVIKKEMDEIESEVISGSKDIDKEVDKVVGKAAGKATSPLTKAGGGLFSNLKTNIKATFGEMEGALKGGSLTGAIDGIGGSLLNLASKAGPYGAAAAAGIGAVTAAATALYKKGAEVDEIRDKFELMFSNKGFTQDEINQQIDGIMSSVNNLSYELDVPKEKLRDLFTFATSSGKTGEAANTFIKQALAVEKLTGETVKADEIMKLLNKGMSDPENEAVFNRLAAKAPELAAALKGAGNEADRLSLLTQFTGGTLEKMAEQAKAPETVFGRLGKVWDEFLESAGGETFDIGNSILAPLSEAVDWIHENMGTIKKIVFDTFNGIREFLSAGWDAISSIFDGFVEGLTPLFEALMELGDEISKLFGGAVEGEDVFSGFLTVLKSVGQVLGGVVKASLQTVALGINLLTKSAAWLVEQIRNMKDAFVRFLQSGNPVANFINSLWKGFTNLLGSIGGVISKILQFLGIINQSDGKEIKVKAKVTADSGEANNVFQQLAASIELFGKTSKGTSKEVVNNWKSSMISQIESMQSMNSLTASEAQKLKTELNKIKGKTEGGSNKAAKTAYDLAVEEVENAKKRSEYQLKQNQAAAEEVRIGQGRAKNAYDELLALDLKSKSLEEQKSSLEKIDKLISYNKEGKAVSISGVKKEDFEKVYNDFLLKKQDLDDSIRNNDEAKLSLQAKLELDPLEMQKKLNDLQKTNIEARIKLGQAKEEDLIPVLKDSIKTAQSVYDKAVNEQVEIRAKIAVAGPISPAEQKALDDAALQVEEAGAKLLKSKTELADKEEALHAKELKNLEDKQKKEENLLQKRLAANKTFYESLQKALEESLSKESDAKKQNELKQLDEAFGKTSTVDPKEEEYNRRKEQIEQEHQDRLAQIQAISRGVLAEQQRESEIESLELKKKQAEDQLKALTPDSAAYNEQAKTLNALNDQLSEKGDLLKSTMQGLQEGIGEFAGSLFTGNEDGMRESAAKMFGFVAGVLKKAASAAIAKLVIDQLQLTPGGLAALALTPVIAAAANVAIGAIIDPIVNSFAGGGRVDEPTMAIIGDNPNSPEWVFRDVDIQAIIAESVVTALKYLALDVTPAKFEEMQFKQTNIDIAMQSIIESIQVQQSNIAALNSRIESAMDRLNPEISFNSPMIPNLVSNHNYEENLNRIESLIYKLSETSKQVVSAVLQNKDVYLSETKVTDGINKVNYNKNKRVKIIL